MFLQSQLRDAILLLDRMWKAFGNCVEGKFTSVECRDGENKTELENCEVLLTDQDSLVYKAYTNGHKLDTSLVWCQIFVKLWQARLLPAIIVPFDHPNAKTFAILRRYVAGEPASVLLSYPSDWLDDFSSYYDGKPVKTVSLGMQIVFGGFEEEGRSGDSLVTSSALL